MKKIPNKFLIGLLFVLGVMLVPAYKVDAGDCSCYPSSPSCTSTRTTSTGCVYFSFENQQCVSHSALFCDITVPAPPPTPITVNVTATPSTINSGNKTYIEWTSTGATSCTPPAGYESAGTGITGNFITSPLYTNTTFTVTCGTAAYCSGNYTNTNVKVNWEGSGSTDSSCPPIHWVVDSWVKKTSSWVEGVYYDYNPNDPSAKCNICGDAGTEGYVVSGSSWYKHTCVQNKFIICWGVRWSKSASYVRSAYLTGSCADLSQSCCNSYSSCTWHPQ